MAGIVGALGIALGAFGAHSLPGILAGLDVADTELPQRKAWFDTGSRYHLLHALALLALAMNNAGTWPRAYTVASIACRAGDSGGVRPGASATGPEGSGGGTASAAVAARTSVDGSGRTTKIRLRRSPSGWSVSIHSSQRQARSKDKTS